MQISKRIKKYGGSFVIVLTREDMEILGAIEGDYIEGDINLIKSKHKKEEKH